MSNAIQITRDPSVSPPFYVRNLRLANSDPHQLHVEEFQTRYFSGRSMSGHFTEYQRDQYRLVRVDSEGRREILTGMSKVHADFLSQRKFKADLMVRMIVDHHRSNTAQAA